MAGLFQNIFNRIEESKSEVVKPNAPLTPAGVLRGKKMIDEMKRNAEAIQLLKQQGL